MRYDIGLVQLPNGDVWIVTDGIEEFRSDCRSSIFEYPIGMQSNDVDDIQELVLNVKRQLDYMISKGEGPTVALLLAGLQVYRAPLGDLDKLSEGVFFSDLLQESLQA